ncbi:MAG: hypothetical protein JWO19_4252 [Bryobacterales bacterium]|nr:hypothetical protein [Bryobacterales bacterium]
MGAYIDVAYAWTIAAFLFYNSYYGIRYPDKYIKAKWTMMRGLPKKRDSASTAAAISMLVGAIFFGGGLLILHALLTQISVPLLPLP